MNKTRLEAFSDGVIAIIITIMVLEVKVPHGHDLHALRSVAPQLCSYLLSFVFVGIYWNNHHHLLHVAKRTTGGIMWANLHLLFWLSLLPFTAAWLGESHSEPLPTAVYGVVLLLAALAYTWLQVLIVRQHDARSKAVEELRAGKKELLSLVCYLTAIAFAFVNRWVSDGLYVLVALVWLVPDKRIERAVGDGGAEVG